MLVQCVTFVIKICPVYWYIFYYYHTLCYHIFHSLIYGIWLDLGLWLTWFLSFVIYLFICFIISWLPACLMLKILYIMRNKTCVYCTYLAFLRLESPERRARGREQSKVKWREKGRVNREYLWSWWLTFRTTLPENGLNQNSMVSGEQGGNLSTHSYCSLLKILADGMLILPCPVFWLHMDGNWAKILSYLHLSVKDEMLGTGGMNEAWGKGVDTQCRHTWRGCSVSTQRQSSQRWLGEEQVNLSRWMNGAYEVFSMVFSLISVCLLF